MDKFTKLITAIKSYQVKNSEEKTTAHHSAVSVRVEEMEKALSDLSVKKEN